MIKVAVIGVGSMGKNHARVYSELNSAELVAVSDIDKTASEEISEKFGCRAYSDYREMLKGEDLDAISIAAPTGLHKKISIDCMDMGKHVLVEKPISNRVENGELMIKKAMEKSVVLTVGHIERFNPGVKKLKELVDNKDLGEITSITAKRVGIYPPQIKDANVVLDLAIHDIDIFNYLLGSRPDEVYAKSGDALKSGREDNAIINLGYGKINCSIIVNWITPVKVRELAVTGTKGYAELNYVTQELKVFESNYERTYDSFGDFVVKFGSPREINIELEKVEPLKAELGLFIESIRARKRPSVTGEEALLALEVAQKVIDSYREKAVLRLG